MTLSRVRFSSFLWLLAWAVLLEAAFALYAPGVGWGTLLLFAGGMGALFRTSPIHFPGPRHAALDGVAGALALTGVVAVLRALAPDAARPLLWLPPWIVLGLLLVADLPTTRRLARLVHVEAGKLWRSRIFQAGVVSTAGVTLLAALTWQEPEAGASAWTMVAGVLGAGQWAAEIFLLVLGATAIAGEATGGTLKMILPHAYTRADWVRAKAAVLVVAALCLEVVAASIAIGAAVYQRGFADVLTPALFGGEAELFLSADTLWAIVLEIALASFAVLVATGLLGLLLSALFDGVVAALCFAFLLFFGLKLADVVLSLPHEAMSGIYAWHPGEMRLVLGQLGRAFSEAPWDAAYLPQALALSLLTATAAVLLAIAALAPRDIKGS